MTADIASASSCNPHLHEASQHIRCQVDVNNPTDTVLVDYEDRYLFEYCILKRVYSFEKFIFNLNMSDIIILSLQVTQNLYNVHLQVFGANLSWLRSLVEVRSCLRRALS